MLKAEEWLFNCVKQLVIIMIDEVLFIRKYEYLPFLMLENCTSNPYYLNCSSLV